MATITAIVMVESVRRRQECTLAEVGQLAPLRSELAGHLDRFGQRIGGRSANRGRNVRRLRCGLVRGATGQDRTGDRDSQCSTHFAGCVVHRGGNQSP